MLDFRAIMTISHALVDPILFGEYSKLVHLRRARIGKSIESLPQKERGLLVFPCVLKRFQSCYVYQRARKERL
jgi:hypothetical protein